MHTFGFSCHHNNNYTWSSSSSSSSSLNPLCPYQYQLKCWFFTESLQFRRRCARTSSDRFFLAASHYGRWCNSCMVYTEQHHLLLTQPPVPSVSNYARFQLDSLLLISTRSNFAQSLRGVTRALRGAQMGRHCLSPWLYHSLPMKPQRCAITSLHPCWRQYMRWMMCLAPASSTSSPLNYCFQQLEFVKNIPMNIRVTVIMKYRGHCTAKMHKAAWHHPYIFVLLFISKV